MWLEMGFNLLKKLRCKLQLCSGAGVSLPACLALSSGQETPTVSAVSLTANEFPGGGVVVVVYECVSDECLDMRGGNRCKKGVGENRKRKQPPGCSGNLHTPGFGTTQQEEMLSQQLRLFLPALLCQRVCLLPASLCNHMEDYRLRQGLHKLNGVLWCSAVADANVF